MFSHSAPKRQRAAALQDVSATQGALEFAPAFGVRQPSAAFGRVKSRADQILSHRIYFYDITLISEDNSCCFRYPLTLFLTPLHGVEHVINVNLFGLQAPGGPQNMRRMYG